MKHKVNARSATSSRNSISESLSLEESSDKRSLAASSIAVAIASCGDKLFFPARLRHDAA
jgi:hypothetical protein